MSSSHKQLEPIGGISIKIARIFWIAGFISYAILIFYVSNQVSESIEIPPLFPNQDKVLHLTEYVPFGWMSLKAFMPVTPIGFVASVGFSLAYAASDEVHQSFVPGREMSVMDWLADAVGILISGYIYYIKYRDNWNSQKIK